MPKGKTLYFIIGGVALVLVYMYWKNAQSGASSSTGTTADTSGAGSLADEYPDLSTEIQEGQAQESSDVSSLQGEITTNAAQETSDVSGLTSVISGLTSTVQGLGSTVGALTTTTQSIQGEITTAEGEIVAIQAGEKAASSSTATKTGKAKGVSTAGSAVANHGTGLEKAGKSKKK